MPATDERDLVARCRRGEDAAFRELVDMYSPMVFALASRLVRPPLRPEDVAQEAFLRVHRGLALFRGDSALGTWIYRIVSNVAFCGITSACVSGVVIRWRSAAEMPHCAALIQPLGTK